MCKERGVKLLFSYVEPRHIDVSEKVRLLAVGIRAQRESQEDEVVGFAVRNMRRR